MIPILEEVAIKSVTIPSRAATASPEDGIPSCVIRMPKIASIPPETGGVAMLITEHRIHRLMNQPIFTETEWYSAM